MKVQMMTSGTENFAAAAEPVQCESLRKARFAFQRYVMEVSRYEDERSAAALVWAAEQDPFTDYPCWRLYVGPRYGIRVESL